MGLSAYRGTTRQAAAWAARPGIALALCLIGGLSLAACSSQANRPIPVASAADLPAATATAPATTADPAVPETSTADPETATTTAALPSDAPAAEDTELPAETYEIMAPADPDEVLGLDRDEVQALLGKPGLVRRESPAEVWQYESRGCVLDVFLYEASADFEVVYIEARTGQAVNATTATCLGSVMDERRQPPAS